MKKLYINACCYQVPDKRVCIFTFDTDSFFISACRFPFKPVCIVGVRSELNDLFSPRIRILVEI